MKFWQDMEDYFGVCCMPTDEELFINDDLENSLENRLNHVLFGLFLNDHYRREVLRCLG